MRRGAEMDGRKLKRGMRGWRRRDVKANHRDYRDFKKKTKHDVKRGDEDGDVFDTRSEGPLGSEGR